MTIDEMRNKLDKFCEGFDLCIDGCPLRKPDDGSCRWNNLSDISTEDCYHFLERLIGKPEQPEINFVKAERNDEVERMTYEEDLIFMRGLAELNKLIAKYGAKMDEEVNEWHT